MNKHIINVDKIFILHYKKLVERRRYMESQLKNFGVENNIEWLIDFDKDEWDLENIKSVNPYMFDGSGVHCKLIKQHLNLSEISLALKHKYCVEHCCENNYDTVLILEDDAKFENDFVHKINSCISTLPMNWDVVFFGGPDDNNSKFYISEEYLKCKIEQFYKIEQTEMCRQTHCYLLNINSCRKLNPYMLCINDPMDWYYNYILNKLKMNVYWYDPPIVIQNQMFKSTLKTNDYYKNFDISTFDIKSANLFS